MLGLNRSEDDGRAAISHGLRVDLSSATHSPAAFGRWVAGRLVDTGANETLCVIYPPEGGPARMSDYRRVVAGMCTPLRVAGVAPLDVLFVADGRWWSFLCDRPTCCPPEGSPVDAGASAIAPLSAYSGLAVLPNRAALAAGLEPYGAEMAERMRAACDAALNRIAAEHAGLYPDTDFADPSPATDPAHPHPDATRADPDPDADADVSIGRPNVHPDAGPADPRLDTGRNDPHPDTDRTDPRPGTDRTDLHPVIDRANLHPDAAYIDPHPDVTSERVGPHPDLDPASASAPAPAFIVERADADAATCCPAALSPVYEPSALPDTHLKTYDESDVRRKHSATTTPLFSDTDAASNDVITNTRTPIPLPGARTPIDSECQRTSTPTTDTTPTADAMSTIPADSSTFDPATVDTITDCIATRPNVNAVDNAPVAFQHPDLTRQILDFDWIDVAHAWRLADSLCDGQVPPDRALDDTAAGELLVGLTDVRVRDYLATWCGDDRAGQAVALSVELARRAVTSEQAAAAFSIAAWAAWALGWGAWSRLCLERAGRAVPGYALATLIKQGLERGVGPELVREAARGTARRLHEMRTDHATAVERESARARKAR